MSNTNTGGPAFPRAPFEYIDNSSGLDWAVREQSGMTLRDYFAAKAMQGMVNYGPWSDNQDRMQIAECAYKLADAMLNARGA
jgi:hypothetical protein